jgi:seryl-tRNA synthetase
MPLGSANASRSANRRIDSLSRERESISRLLAQAGLERIEQDIEALKEKLDSIEEILSGSSN